MSHDNYTYNYYKGTRYRRPNIADFAEKKPTQFHDIFLKYFRCQYRRKCPISQNNLEISITNYFVGVMNDVIFWIELPKFSFQLLFDGVWWSI